MNTKQLPLSMNGPSRHLAGMLNCYQSASFEQIWPRLEIVINKIFNSQPIPKAEWQASFYDVYKICMWNGPAAYRLKERLKQVIQNYMSVERQKLDDRGHNSLSLLKAYIAAWQRFMYFYVYIPLPFTPLERYFAVKGKSNPSADSSAPKKTDLERFIQFTLNEMWIDTIFNDYGSQLVTYAVMMVTAERDNQVYDPDIIVTIKNSCVQLGIFFHDKLYFYRNNFERIYVFQTMEYYRKESFEYYYKKGVIAYMQWAYNVFKDETDRANRYLEPHSLSKLITALVYIIVTNFKTHMIEQFTELLGLRDLKLLRIMFDLLNRLPDNGVQPIQYLYQDYIVEDAHREMMLDAQTITTDSERYVEFLLNKHNQITEMINVAFNADPRFFTSRDIAFNQIVNDVEVFKFASKIRQNNTTDNEEANDNANDGNNNNEAVNSNTTNNNEAVNSNTTNNNEAVNSNTNSNNNDNENNNNNNNNQLANLSTKMETLELGSHGIRFVDYKSVELFANYTDLLLRKTYLSRRLTPEELEGRMKSVILMLKYITNKDMFMKFYKAHLTRRLLLDTTGDYDKEENVIGQLRGIGMPAEFINKIGRMFQDMKISDDLNRGYRDYIRARPSLHAEIVTFKVINSSAWSRVDERQTISLPIEIERTLPSFESYYKRKFNGRNLHWQYQLSSGLITYHSNLGDYDLDVTSYQLCVLQAWNLQPETRVTFEALMLYTNLPNLDLRRTLWSLMAHNKIKTPLILTDKKYRHLREFTDSSQFYLNLNFTVCGRNGRQARRGRYNYIGRLMLNNERSREEDLKNIYNLRCFRIQEGIMKVLKMRKMITFNNLYLELVEILKHLFMPTKDMIIKRLAELINMELVQQDKLNPDCYYYIA